MEGDAAQALAVLEWAREHGVAVSAVTCGACTVSLFEPRSVADGKRQPVRPGGQGIYQTLGGAVWADAVRSGNIEGPGHGSADGDDLEPAVGNG